MAEAINPVSRLGDMDRWKSIWTVAVGRDESGHVAVSESDRTIPDVLCVGFSDIAQGACFPMRRTLAGAAAGSQN